MKMSWEISGQAAYARVLSARMLHKKKLEERLVEWSLSWTKERMWFEKCFTKPALSIVSVLKLVEKQVAKEVEFQV